MSPWTPQRIEWDEKRVEELKDALAKVDRPRSTRPVKKSECQNHVFIESDRCHWCGEPQDGA